MLYSILTYAKAYIEPCCPQVLVHLYRGTVLSDMGTCCERDTEQDSPLQIYSTRLSSFIYRSITPKRTARIEPRMSFCLKQPREQKSPQSCVTTN